MKKMLIILLYLISVQISNAQNNDGFARLNDSTFVQVTVDNQSLVKTRYRWISRSVEYPIYINRKTGYCYILKTSKKTGKEYKSKINENAARVVAKELGIEYIEK